MMKGYTEYKTSKFKWIEKIPNHWIESRISYLFEIGRGRVISLLEINPEGQYPVYSSQTKYDGCMGFIDTYDFDDNILTWTTDGANAGTVFIRSGKFNCTNVCGTLKPKKEINIKFFLYYLQHVTQFYKRPDTNGAKIMNNEMAGIYCLIPTQIEQSQIACFLDHQTALIDEIIQRKEKQINLLKEKRQSIINEVVTKGLNPNEKMKDSGIKWIGNIPEDWKICKLKHIVSMQSGSSITSESIEDEGDFPVFGGNGLRGYVNTFTNDGEFVLIGRQGALCGNINYAKGKFWASEHAVVVYPIVELDSFYLGEMLRIMNLNQYSESAAQPGLSVNKILNLRIPKIPLEEQIKISTFIKNETIRLDDLVSKINSQIGKLKEYRQSLISETVTGKIDVRDWQPTTTN